MGLNAQPSVRYLEARKTWLLTAAHSQYALTLNREGELVHLWWGPRLPVGDFESNAIAPVENRGQFGENILPLDYPGWGDWRYLEPALKVRFADGVRDLRLRYSAHQIEGDRLTVTLKDTHYPFVVEVWYRVRPQFDLIERGARLRNTGDQPIDVEQALSAVWHLPHLQKWTMSYLAGKWGAETQRRQVELGVGKFQIESRRGATSHHFQPWFAVSETGGAGEERGEVWFGSLAWSGSWKVAAEINAGGRLQVAGGVHDFDFGWHLKPGETFETPMFVGGFSAAGFGGASRQLHA